MEKKKFKLMKKYILPIILILILLWLAFDKVSNIGLTEEFKTKQDSLVHAVDSMQLEIAKDDAEIDSLDIVAVELQYKLDHQKAKVKTIVEYIEVEKNNIDGFSNPELVSSFNKRYPTDTITTPLLVAQPVLVSAAKDLVELDGAKQIIVLKDSSINTLEEKVTVKDSVIAKYVSKENTYKNMVANQQTQIKDWKFQYNTLQLENTKLKAKNKFTKIGAGLIAGGLVYLMLVK
jgi:peptidoglycan hydrolase CwlO-like protein